MDRVKKVLDLHELMYDEFVKIGNYFSTDPELVNTKKLDKFNETLQGFKKKIESCRKEYLENSL